MIIKQIEFSFRSIIPKNPVTYQFFKIQFIDCILELILKERSYPKT